MSKPQTLEELKARFPQKPWRPIKRGWKPPTTTAEDMRDVVEQGIALELNIPGLMASNAVHTQAVRSLLANHGDYPKDDPALSAGL